MEYEHDYDLWCDNYPPEADPVCGDDGYPHDVELWRIEHWPATTTDDLLTLMAYVKERWSYPEYWDEADVDEYSHPQREFTVSTGGWSGNESLISTLELHTMFRIIAPWSWRRGGHYVYRIPIKAREESST